MGTVFGVTGGKVALPCNITPPSHDDAVSLILWYKDDSTTPIYRYAAPPLFSSETPLLVFYFILYIFATCYYVCIAGVSQ